MASQIPVVFLPSGISRISPDGFETGDPQVDQEVLLYREKSQSGTTKTLKLNEKIPRLVSTSAMEGLGKSNDFLHDMAMDEVEKMSDFEQDESQRETSTRPNSTEPTTANAKTLKTYQSHVRVFKDWLKSEGLPADFEYCSAEELSSWLKKFYRDGKRKDGQQWKPSSLKIFRFAINQHLNSERINRSISITRDKQFKDANKVISDRQKELIQLGEDATGGRENQDNARALTCEDIRQLFDQGVIGVTSPKALHRYVFMILGINFGITSRLALHLLKPSMLYFEREETSGLLYIYYNPKRDNSGGDEKKLSRPKKKIYGIPGNPLCPVAALKLFIQKRNPECTEGFFQTPNRHYKETGVWYTPQATGKNTLGRLMKDIAIEGQLSFLYTNHCLRYTPPYVFTPPDPKTLACKVSNGATASINAIQRDLRPLDSESMSLQIRPTVSVNNTEHSNKLVVSSGIHIDAVNEKGYINSTPTMSYSSSSMPLLYPPVRRNNMTPLTNTSQEDGVLRNRDPKPSFSSKAGLQVHERRPKTTDKFKTVKTHNVLCVPRQWQMGDIINAISSGDAILLSRHDVTGTRKFTDTESIKQRDEFKSQSEYELRDQFISYLKYGAGDVVSKQEEYLENRANGVPPLLKSDSSKLSSRSSRKQLEPKRIRPDEIDADGDNNFQIDVAYEDAVTNIQANLSVIEKLQRDHLPSKQTINNLEKLRFRIDRILSDTCRPNIHM